MNNNQLAREDLLSLEEYSNQRQDFRAKVMEHKKNRQVLIGEHVALYFEDRLTMQYQIQEMLRIERIFESEPIQEELDAYNPLIPSGSDLKATMMIEYADEEERREALIRLKDVEDTVWVQVKGFERVYAVADEDLERSNDEKTSAVHFMRFTLEAEMVAAAKQGADLSLGVAHAAYPLSVEPLPNNIRDSLCADFN